MMNEIPCNLCRPLPTLAGGVCLQDSHKDTAEKMQPMWPVGLFGAADLETEDLALPLTSSVSSGKALQLPESPFTSR